MISVLFSFFLITVHSEQIKVPYSKELDYKYTYKFECQAHKADCFTGLQNEDIKESCCYEREFSLIKEKSKVLNEQKGCDLFVSDKAYDQVDNEIPRAQSEIWKFAFRRRFIKTDLCPMVPQNKPCPTGFKEEPFTKNYKFCLSQKKIKIETLNQESDMSAKKAVPAQKNSPGRK